MNKTIILFLFPVMACSNDKSEDSGSDVVADALGLTGTQWLLDSSEGFEPVGSESLRLNFFEVEDQGVRFNMGTGCNSLGGYLLVEDGKASISSTGMTEIGCSMELHEQENWLYAFAMSSPEIAKSGDNLIFTGTDASLTYIDEEVAVPDLPLVGTSWTIDSYIDGDAVDAMNLENDPTISFSENGTLDVFSGCNSCDGSYTVDAAAGTLTVTSFNCTEMECMDDLIQEAEWHVTTVFWGENITFDIDATRLTVMSGDKGVSAIGE